MAEIIKNKIKLEKTIDKVKYFKYNNNCATKDAQLHNLTLVK